MARKKIVLVTYGGGHVNMMVPVIKELQKNHNMELLVLGLTVAGWILQKNNIPCIGFKDLMKPHDKHARTWGERLVGTIHPRVSYDESVAYMGLSYVDLELRHGVDVAADIYRNQGGRYAFYPLTVMENFLKSETPDMVIATSAPRAERAAIMAAGALAIRSICLVYLFARKEMQWIGRRKYADKLCVLSDFVKQDCMLAGRNDEDIVVTGNPAFDGMKKLVDPNMRKRFRQHKGWKDEELIVLWLSKAEPERHPFSEKTGDPLLPRKVEWELCKLVKEHSNIRAVFRPHPSDASGCHGVLPEKVEISTINEDDFDTLLASSDCIIVTDSTGGYQAALLGKPLVNIKQSIFSAFAPYDEMGMSVGVDDVKLLNRAVLKALSSGQRSDGLPEVGGATDKVVRVIEEVLAL